MGTLKPSTIKDARPVDELENIFNPLTANWLSAQTLAERLEALAGNPAALEFFDREKAQAGLASWKKIRAFAADEACFLRRLQTDNCSPEEFLHVLGIPARQIFETGYLPHWLAEVFQSEEEPQVRLDSPALERARARGLLSAFLPLISFYANRLFQSLLTDRDLLASTKLPAQRALDLFLSPLLQGVEHFSQRATALEINVQRLLGKLAGDTAEARFQSFQAKMQDQKERLAFLGKYPVLTRSLQKRMELWVEASREFLERLARDSEEIRSVFGITPDDWLTEFRPSGDTHCQGRAVVIVTFASGKKILYKPHSLSIDRHFQELLIWCNEQGFAPPLKTITLMAKDSYGWVEFVEARPACDDNEIAAFYRRLGHILALFYALGTVDMHFENLIAAGPDPVVIDLETLLHPSPQLTLTTASDLVSQNLLRSVMAIGLLPVPEAAEGNHPFDVSGIGASAGQKAPYKVSFLKNVGKDDMHIDHVEGWIDSVQSRPSSDSERGIPVQHLLDGFESGFRVLLKNKELLLAGDGPVSSFRQDTGRLVLRATRVYASMSMDAGHPDLLRDDLDRTMHWDGLWNGIATQPFLEKCIPSELEQILQGDIPFFSNILSSTSLTGTDGKRIESVLAQSGLDNARERIEKLSEQELAAQSWFIRASLGYVDGYCRKPRTEARASGKQERQTYLEAACQVGSEVVSNLSFYNDMAGCLAVSCISADEGDRRAYSIAPAGLALYEGLAGIALFLAYLSQESGNQTYRKSSEALLRNVQRVQSIHPLKQPGAFSGLGSLVYLYCHLALLFDRRRELLKEAEDLLGDISSLIETDEVLDIIGGTAGCLLSLLPLAALRPEGKALAVARQCGDHLLEKAGSQEALWKTLPISRGFSHGLSGIAYALHRLACATQEEKYTRAALDAIQLERSLLADGKWTDHHMTGDRPQLSWCHGAAGIALSRLGIYASHAALEIRQDIEQALSECKKHYWLDSQCICHGSLGNLEPFLVASQQCSEFGDWSVFIDQVSKRVLADIADSGWRSMGSEQTLSQGLMTGVSGIGYAFLRLHNPAKVPSVLCLAGPAC